MSKYKKQFSTISSEFCNDYKDLYIKYLEAKLVVRDAQIQELEASEKPSNCNLGGVRTSYLYLVEYGVTGYTGYYYKFKKIIKFDDVNDMTIDNLKSYVQGKEYPECDIIDVKPI